MPINQQYHPKYHRLPYKVYTGLAKLIKNLYLVKLKITYEKAKKRFSAPAETEGSCEDPQVGLKASTSARSPPIPSAPNTRL